MAVDDDKCTEARCYLGLDHCVKGSNDKAAAHLAGLSSTAIPRSSNTSSPPPNSIDCPSPPLPSQRCQPSERVGRRTGQAAALGFKKKYKYLTDHRRIAPRGRVLT